MREYEGRNHSAGSVELREAESGPNLLKLRAMQRRRIQRKATSSGAQAGEPDAAEENAAELDADEGKNDSGQSLDDAVKKEMEEKFDTDFSDVKIHIDDDKATKLGAHAFTEGTNVHFAPGAYQPGTPAGKELIAHELTHVVQQKGGSVKGEAEAEGEGAPDNAGESPSGAKLQKKAMVSQPGDADEVEADRNAALVSAGKKVQVSAAPAGMIQRGNAQSGDGAAKKPSRAPAAAAATAAAPAAAAATAAAPAAATGTSEVKQRQQLARLRPYMKKPEPEESEALDKKYNFSVDSEGENLERLALTQRDEIAGALDALLAAGKRSTIPMPAEGMPAEESIHQQALAYYVGPREKGHTIWLDTNAQLQDLVAQAVSERYPVWDPEIQKLLVRVATASAQMSSKGTGSSGHSKDFRR